MVFTVLIDWFVSTKSATILFYTLIMFILLDGYGLGSVLLWLLNIQKLIV